MTAYTAPIAIHPRTRMGAVTLGIADLKRSVDFYRFALGMQVLTQEQDRATMGVDSTPLVHLVVIPDAKPLPQRATGLYHVAILLPSRADLGRVIINLARLQYPVTGFADHHVSEAMYLDDPDGNGIEIYRDRQRDEWNWNGKEVVMGTDPIDLNGIVAEVKDPNAPFTGMPKGTTVGHVHLRIADLTQTQAFYSDILGFDIVTTYPGALFASAGGYHHHLGLNTWQSRNAPRPPADAVGLREFVVIVPDDETLSDIKIRLQQSQRPFEIVGNDLLVEDPSGNRMRMTIN